MADVETVVENCQKQRFTLKTENGQRLIRANQVIGIYFGSDLVRHSNLIHIKGIFEGERVAIFDVKIGFFVKLSLIGIVSGYLVLKS